MYTKDNYSFDGQQYNYDALNAILTKMLAGSTNADDVKNYSDKINDALVETDGKIMYNNIQVGHAVNYDEE